VELRARYIVSSALMSAHLHPSALPSDAARPQTGALASRSFTWPVIGAVTQPFGVPELGVGAPHTGLDIGVGTATPVLASASGVVTFAGGDPSTGYGYYAIVDDGGGVSTLYGHLALPPFLHPGQFLAQGGLIGLSGSTGFSTGPHLHFEVRLNGVPVDPQRVLPPITAR
jgi:murein DD-endopeptidase MepM/ murein hydrolase activator NlpD